MAAESGLVEARREKRTRGAGRASPGWLPPFALAAAISLRSEAAAPSNPSLSGKDCLQRPQAFRTLSGRWKYTGDRELETMVT
jgi:hypothetical protein